MAFRVAVRRFNPSTDTHPYISEYDVELDATKTVLDGLLYIEEHLEPTLAFRRMCRSGICGTCAGVVNGRPRLFCQTRLGEVSSVDPLSRTYYELLLEPLPQFQVLKDLVVDVDPFFRELERVEAWLMPNDSYAGRVSPRVMERLWPIACCILCGICAEPAGSGATTHAAAVARVLRFAEDPRDAIGEARRAALHSLDDDARRHLVTNLRAVCPAGVDVEGLLYQKRHSQS